MVAATAACVHSAGTCGALEAQDGRRGSVQEGYLLSGSNAAKDDGSYLHCSNLNPVFLSRF